MAKTLGGFQGDQGSNFNTNSCVLDVCWLYMCSTFTFASHMLTIQLLYIGYIF
jgi:hypothetical protein